MSVLSVSSSPLTRWRKYVAIGDSFTEGMCDPYPLEGGLPGTDDGLQRGWADRLADELSARRVAAGLDKLEYSNLAIRGRKLEPILGAQLPRALDMQPDLISIVGGGNDILRAGSDIDELLNQLEEAVSAAQAAGADVLLATGFKAGGGLAWTRSRTGQFNSGIYTIARRAGVPVMDMWGMRSLYDWRMWAPDRLHLTAEGHRRIHNLALEALGLEPTDRDYDVPLPQLDPLPLVEKVRLEAEWTKEHVAPWIKRRLRGQSSGDGRTEKWPAPTPWPVGARPE